MTDVLDRLNKFFKQLDVSKSEFARRMNILPQNINKYLNGDLDIQGIAFNLLKEGCNLQWLFENSGKMYADNAAGWNLYFKKNFDDLLAAMERINYFIIIHYGSIAKLELKFNLDKGYITRMLNDKNITDPFFIVVMNIIGCNMHWVWSGDGSMYHDNQTGEQLQEKTTNHDVSHENDYDKEWYRKTQSIDERLDRLENLIRNLLTATSANKIP